MAMSSEEKKQSESESETRVTRHWGGRPGTISYGIFKGDDPKPVGGRSYAKLVDAQEEHQHFQKYGALPGELSPDIRAKYIGTPDEKQERSVEEGPRGGRYYIGSTGEKVYVKPNPGAEPVGRVSHMPFRAGLPAPVAQAEPVRAAFAPSPNSMAATYGQQVPFEIKEGK